MSKTFLSLFAGLALGAMVACERHPASETVPGYEEKAETLRAEQQRMARTPLPINPVPPRFFPASQPP